MITYIIAAAIITASYFIGAIPTGLLVGLYGYGVDVRQQGSGNIGSTNTLRTLGVTAALLVLAGDVAKGFISVSLAALLFPHAPTLITNYGSVYIFDSLVVVLSAAMAMVGNNFSIYLKFHGGKGIGITAGIILALSPAIAGILFLIWVTILAVTRLVSLGSIIIALLFPVLMYLFFGELWPYIAFSLLAAAMAVFRHRTNIARLYERKELRLGETAKEK